MPPTSSSSSSSPSSLPLEDQVRALLSSTVIPTCSRDGAATVEEVWREVAQQAQRQLQTEVLRTALASDPFERWFRDKDKDKDDTAINQKIQRLQERVQVVDYNCVRTRQDYVSIEATVRLPATSTFDSNESSEKRNARKKQRRSPAAASIIPFHDTVVNKHVQLQSRYERTTCDNDASSASPSPPGARVWYSIDLSKDYGPSERLLWVQVWADGAVPAPGRAKNMDDDDLWSDVDDDDDDDEEKGMEEEKKTAETKSSSDEDDYKDEVGDDDVVDDDMGMESDNGRVALLSTAAVSTSKTQQSPQDHDENVEEVDEQPRDRFVAGIDPDLLQQFLNWTHLAPMDDLTAFFLLMTIPFYEHEWDLVGLLLDAVFGLDGDGDDGEGKEEESGSE